MDTHQIAQGIKKRAKELGFLSVGITNLELKDYEPRLLDWLCKGYHASMRYMTKHGLKRTRPWLLQPDIRRLVMVTLNYTPKAKQDINIDPHAAVISHYATGRDYHKVLRGKLKKLRSEVLPLIEDKKGRIFCDSAPFLEKALAQKAGLGWIGKHSNLLNTTHGSWFFIGGFTTNLDLPVDLPSLNHCGKCTSCMNACPTGAIIAPYVVDARRCISYWTIEHEGIIPNEIADAMGNRIYGCDDCQLVCPWNRFSKPNQLDDFAPRYGLEQSDLLTLSSWSEQEFNEKTKGMALRRINYAQWLRNIVIALGNAPKDKRIADSLKEKQSFHDLAVRHHCKRALRKHLT